ncbi:MAG: PEP-CTERM sorting domain-containing protein [Planctomycetota bacterium]
MKNALLLVALAILPCTTQAGILGGVDPFTGDLSEGFNSVDTGFTNPIRVFDDTATLSGDFGIVTNNWGFVSTIRAFEGQLMYGAAGGPANFLFDTAIGKFGGYFGTNVVNSTTDAADAIANFYDVNNSLIGTHSILLANGGTWTWSGFQSTTDNIKRIEIVGATHGGGLVQMDALEASRLTSTVVPEPSTALSLGIGLLGLFFTRRRR